MPNVQQIKTPVCGYNLLSSRPQLLAAIGKLLKLDDFWAHSFSLILRLCVNRSWPLTDLRDGLPRMTKRKTKRNAGRSQTHDGFKICKSPVVHVADNAPLRDAHDRIDATRVDRQPVLFAIARDPRTIFTSWNIDWRSVFEKTVPADRHVHLRVIGGDGITETIVVVEPMSEMHYLTVSGLQDSYH